MEKVIVDLDLGASLKVVWQQHHGGRYLAELIDLRSRNKNREPVSRGGGATSTLYLGKSQKRATQTSFLYEHWLRIYLLEVREGV